MNTNETPVKPVETLGIQNRRGSSLSARSSTPSPRSSATSNLFVRGMSKGTNGGLVYNNEKPMVMNRRRIAPSRAPSRLRNQRA